MEMKFIHTQTMKKNFQTVLSFPTTALKTQMYLGGFKMFEKQYFMMYLYSWGSTERPSDV